MPALAITLLQLIVQHGIPAAMKIWQTVRETGGEPTQADWDKLLALEQERAASFRRVAEAALAKPADPAP